jgi:competence protein ComFC
MKILQTIIHTCLDALFPLSCVLCGQKSTTLCEDCAQKLPKSQNNETGNLSAYRYQSESVRKIVQTLKYENYRTLSRQMGALMHDELVLELSEKLAGTRTEDVVVIPIPLSRTRMQKRGFNQASLLAEAFLKRGNMSFILNKDVLLKIKDTSSQVSVSQKAKRLENIKDSFRVEKPDIVRNKIILLFDDVTTTGATLNEASKMLCAAGAAKVIGITFAH